MKKQEIIDVNSIKSETNNNFSLKLKWSISTTVGSALIFTLCYILLFHCFSNILLKQQKNIAYKVYDSIEYNLKNCDVQLDYNNINKDLIDKISNNFLDSKKNFNDSIYQNNLIVSIYNVKGNLLFSTYKPIIRFDLKNSKFGFVKLYKNNHSILLLRKPLIFKNKKLKLGYVQIIDQLEPYDSIRHELFILFIIIGLIVCISIAIMSYYLSSILLRPIDLLNDAIHRINNNDDEAKALSEVRVPIISTNDELSYLSILFNDMLDKMQRYIEQQQEFVGDVSHELRTPVTIIQGHLDLLKRWGKNDPKVLEESINASLQEIDRMKNLVQEMLDLSRAEQVEIQYGHKTCDAKEVTFQVYNDFKMIHPDFDIKLDNDLKSSAMVRIYRNHLEQILIILLDNAVKYSNYRKEIYLTLSKNERYAEFVVQDFGEGISEDNIQKIFNRFYRVDKARSRSKGGNGLGLSIAEHLVEGYHGRISVESVENEGSLFKVELPLAIKS